MLARLASTLAFLFAARLEAWARVGRVLLGLPPRVAGPRVAGPVRPVKAGPTMNAVACRQKAFGPERARQLDADAATLAAAFPSPDVLAHAEVLSPDAWGAVRDAFSELRKRKQGAIAAIPAVAAWLRVAPGRVGMATGYLDGWEQYALHEGWETAAVLHVAARSAADRVDPGPVADALARALALCGELADDAIRCLRGAPGRSQRGAVSFLATQAARADEARAALLAYARSPSPLDDAWLGYARGEAMRAYTDLGRWLPREEPEAQVVGPASWEGRLAAFRALAGTDEAAARAEARDVLIAGTPATPAGNALRREAVALLERPVERIVERVVSGDAWDTEAGEPEEAAPKASAARARLVALAGPDQPTRVRIAALESLARVQAEVPEYLDLLVAASCAEDPDLREVAARLLGDVA